MNENTTYDEVIDSFEASFADKKVIPHSLEKMWLLKAIARYSTELEVVNFDSEILEFDKKLDQYIIDTLAAMMREMYQVREYSRVNKIASIVGKDLSVNAGMSLSKNSKEELEYHNGKLNDMIGNQKPTAYV